MIRFRGRVAYKDGREVELEAGSAAVAEWELYALRHGYPIGSDSVPGVLMALVIAHASLGIEEGFDVWRRTVDGIELAPVDVPPTLPAPSPASASSSRSASDGA